MENIPSLQLIPPIDYSLSDLPFTNALLDLTSGQS